MQIDPGTATTIGAIATIIGAFIGFIGGLVVAGINFRQKNDELFFKALDFLRDGGSQNRNLGISAIELYWSQNRWMDWIPNRRKSVCVSLLSGTAIYLLRESKQKDAAHELNNLDRIMSLLLSNEKIKKSQNLSYENLQKALVEALKESEKDGNKGEGLFIEKK